MDFNANIIEDIIPVYNHGLVGIIECSSAFYDNLIMLVKPTSIKQISKLIATLHSSGVWPNNADELIKNKTITLDDLITTREDLFDLLINYNVDENTAKEIVKKVTSSKPTITNKELKKILINSNVPKWIIFYLKKINYLPKREVINDITLLTYRLAWFKKNYPKEFYKSLFQLNNNKILFKYIHKDEVIIFKELNKINKKKYTISPDDYNSMKDYHKELNNLTHKSTLLLSLIEIKANEDLIDYLLQESI